MASDIHGARRATILQRSRFISCAAVNSRNTRNQFSRTGPEYFSFPVFLFQALVTLLRFPPQIISGQHQPLRVRVVQIQVQVCHFFRKVSLRVKSEVPRNKPLPHTWPIGQVDLVHLVARQLMGGVDFSQEPLCGQFPLNIFLPCQPSVLAPLVVLLVVHGYQVGTLRGCRVLPAEQAGIHSVPQLFTNQERLILRSPIQPCQIRATLFAALPVGHPVTVSGGLFRFWDEIAPAVVTSADPLVALFEVERQHQHPQFHQTAKPERPWFFQPRQLCRIADPRNVGIC